jgi:dTDP-4-dehydrorhamnose 3,5-epimerase
MKNLPTKIGCDRFSDTRGSLVKLFTTDNNDLPLNFQICDQYISTSKKFVFRGLHMQPNTSKLIKVVRGSIIDVSFKLGDGGLSPDRIHEIPLKACEDSILFIPSNYYHGFLAMEDETQIICMSNLPHDPKHEKVFSIKNINVSFKEIPMITSQKDS